MTIRVNTPISVTCVDDKGTLMSGSVCASNNKDAKKLYDSLTCETRRVGSAFKNSSTLLVKMDKEYPEFENNYDYPCGVITYTQFSNGVFNIVYNIFVDFEIMAEYKKFFDEQIHTLSLEAESLYFPAG